jgi:hypothetical protein
MRKNMGDRFSALPLLAPRRRISSDQRLLLVYAELPRNHAYTARACQNNFMTAANSTSSVRVWDIRIISALMVIFGIAEIHTGFSHKFFGVTTEPTVASTYAGAVLGLLYALAGGLCLVRKRWSIRAAITTLTVVVIGRIAMVVLGYFPITTAKQTFSIVAGTALAALFTLYLWWRRKSCD